MIEVAYIPQRNNGILNQVIPGGRIVLIVTIKFKPVNIELKPKINAPKVAAITLVCVVTLYGV